MLCQKCHMKTATVFISSMINGQETKMYLCNDCANDYPLFNLNFQDPFSIKDIMDKLNIDENTLVNEEDNKLLAMDDASIYKDEEEIICPNCYSTYEEYQETGKFGCSKCYESFENKLSHIFKNRYGYEEYIGKIPKSANSEKYISNEIRILKEDLNRAVELEEYEKAADIRDKIKELQECNE